MPPAPSPIAEKLSALRAEMDRRVIGHEPVKDALLMGLVAREHIYIEGPPGIAKTMLAEVASQASNLGFYFYQFHRDTRLAEMVGDVVIVREAGEDGSEVIGQTIRKGGVLTAEVCVLDDISRAPGEALNVLLRILNERKYHTESIPLLTAIATSNPALDDYYNEPLDPANLDRFTLQLQAEGLIFENRWREVEQVINLFCQPSNGKETAAVPTLLSRADFDEAYDKMNRVEVPDAAKLVLMHLLNRFVNQYKLDNTKALISDRAFLVKAVKLMKTRALLDGRSEVRPHDLHVLAFMTAFRLPPEIHRDLPAIIEDTLVQALGPSV
ncbi:MAG: MoxR family ATPase [Deltaproteobacteria bacterium]|nr:MoxR family ATPase [Deltaproteobacteria bacterium]